MCATQGLSYYNFGMKRNSSNSDWTALFRFRLNFLSFFFFQLCAYYQSALRRKPYRFFLFHFPPITPDTQAKDLQMALGSKTVFSALS